MVSQNNRCQPIENFSKPLLIEIFNYLSVEDLRKVGSVCKKFSLIQNSPSLWIKFLDYKDGNDSIKYRIDEELMANHSLKAIILTRSLMQINLANVATVFPCVKVWGKSGCKIAFLHYESDRREYIKTTIKAMKYLPRLSYLGLYHIPGGDTHTYVYKDKEEKIVTWEFKYDADNYLSHPNEEDEKEIKRIETGGVRVESVFPRRFYDETDDF